MDGEGLTAAQSWTAQIDIWLVSDVLKAKDQGMVAVKVAFDQAKIEIPYPIQVVYPAPAHVTQTID